MKFLAAIFTTLLTTSAMAKTQVPVYWPFSIGNVQAQAVRVLLDAVNDADVDPDFRYVQAHKPGAGSAIAARRVAQQNGAELLSVSSSYFIRPLFYPEDSHAVADLQPVVRISTNQPVLIVGKPEYQSLADLQDKESVTIGMINGSVTNLIAATVQTGLPNTDLIMVPYKGTVEPMLDVIGGSLDLNVGFIDEAEKHQKAGKVSIVGATGTEPVRGNATFVDQGATKFADINLEYWIMTDADVPEKRVRELHAMFTEHLQAGAPYWAQDEAQVVALTYEETMEHFWAQEKFWRELKAELLPE